MHRLTAESYFGATTIALIEQTNDAIAGINSRRAALEQRKQALHALASTPEEFTNDHVDEAARFNVRRIEIDRDELLIRRQLKSQVLPAIRAEQVAELQRAESDATKAEQAIRAALLKVGFAELDGQGRNNLDDMIRRHPRVREAREHVTAMQSRAHGSAAMADNNALIDALEKTCRESVRKLVTV